MPATNTFKLRPLCSWDTWALGSAKIWLLSIMVALAWLPTQTVLAKTDPLCAPLRAFVQSVQPDESRVLEFRTSWGSSFKDSTEPALFAKRCNHFGYSPAETMCEYLVKHGATEFSDNNLKRSVMCLSPKTKLDSGLSIADATFSLSYGSDDRGALVSLKLVEDPKIGGVVLRISVDGY